METFNFRLAEEKNFNTEVLLFAFNPEHDIIVICLANGDVIAYQAYIRKVWALGTRSQRRKPISLAWRPDGQILAVTFSNRTLVFASVQDGYQLLSETLSQEIRLCNWVERFPDDQDENVDLSNSTVPIDDYLPALVDLPSVNRARKHIVDPPDDLFSLEKQTRLNILILFGQNEILLRAFGLWPLLSISRTFLPTDQTILSVSMTPTLDNICLLTRSENSINYSLLNATSFLSENHGEYFHLSRSIGRIKSLIIFNEKIFNTLVELTGKCFSDFQSRVTSFCQTSRQQNLRQWTFQCELMALLSTGNCSETMQQNFFGNAFDYGYAKKLVALFEETRSKSKELIVMFNRTIEHIFGYLVEIKGLQQWHGKFNPIEFDPTVLEGCLSNAGSLLLKINEYNDFIQEMSDVYTFFLRWLGFVAHQLHTSRHYTNSHHDEQIECSEADWDHLIEFIDNYCSFEEPNLDIFSMYLKSENLPETLIRDSVYRKLMDHSIVDQSKSSCFSPKSNRTLYGAFQDLKQSINKAFDIRTVSDRAPLNRSFSNLATMPIESNVEIDHRRSKTSVIYVIQNEPQKFHLIGHHFETQKCFLRSIDLQFILSPQRSLISFKVYDDEKLSIVCGQINESSNSSHNDSFSMINPNSSHLMIINLKSLFDSPSNEYFPNHMNILLSYPLKDLPAKLTVDGRRNLIAVIIDRDTIFHCHLTKTNSICVLRFSSGRKTENYQRSFIVHPKIRVKQEQTEWTMKVL